MIVESANTEVSGKSFLGLIRYIKDKGGKELLDRIVGNLCTETKQVFSERITAVDWYRYPAFVEFLEAIRLEIGRGDPKCFMNIGKISAKRDMGTIFQIYKLISNPEKIIRSCGLFWKGYYRNAGEINAVAFSPDNTILRITDFPHMHPNHCQLVNGYMIALMEELGCVCLNEAETKCTSRGDLFHEFVYQWESKKARRKAVV